MILWLTSTVISYIIMRSCYLTTDVIANKELKLDYWMLVFGIPVMNVIVASFLKLSYKFEQKGFDTEEAMEQAFRKILFFVKFTD